MADGDLLTISQRPTMHTTHCNTSCVATIVERRDEHLRCSLYLLGCGNHLYNLVEQIGNVVSGILPLLSHPSVLGGTIDNREIELVFSGVEREHQVEHHFVDFLGAAVGFVDLVDHNNGFQTNLQCLLQHESSLRHRTFKSINQQQTAIGHVQHALNLTTKIAVSRGVDNIDFRSFPIDGNVLGKNGDTAFALQVVGVEHLAGKILSFSEKMSSQHHFVHKRRLAVVNVRYNGNVPNVLHFIIL